jgi:hypothetical protein
MSSSFLGAVAMRAADVAAAAARPALLCAHCAATIVADTSELLHEQAPCREGSVWSYELEILETSVFVYSATNPTDDRFDVARVGPAACARLIFEGEPTPEHSWFPPFGWVNASCRRCQHQLGWVFMDAAVRGSGGGGADSEPVFAGLIVTRLRESRMPPIGAAVQRERPARPAGSAALAEDQIAMAMQLLAAGADDNAVLQVLLPGVETPELTAPLMETMRSLLLIQETIEDAEENDEELNVDGGRRSNRVRAQNTGISWRESGHRWLGRRVRRFFDGADGADDPIDGTLVLWVDAEGDDAALWHMAHDDGDEEDLEEHEVRAALRAHSNELDAPADTSEAPVRSPVSMGAEREPCS